MRCSEVTWSHFRCWEHVITPSQKRVTRSSLGFRDLGVLQSQNECFYRLMLRFEELSATFIWPLRTFQPLEASGVMSYNFGTHLVCNVTSCFGSELLVSVVRCLRLTFKVLIRLQPFFRRNVRHLLATSSRILSFLESFDHTDNMAQVGVGGEISPKSSDSGAVSRIV